ncbi:hypothetical protein GIB67_038943, partial [Kingdonia uniflora]
PVYSSKLIIHVPNNLPYNLTIHWHDIFHMRIVGFPRTSSFGQDCYIGIYSKIRNLEHNINEGFGINAAMGRRDGLHLLAEEAVIAADKAAGVRLRKSYRYPIGKTCVWLIGSYHGEGTFSSCSSCGGSLVDEDRRVEYDRYLWCDVFRELLLDTTLREDVIREIARDKLTEEDKRAAGGKIIPCASSGENNLLEKQHNHSSSVKIMGRVEDYGSFNTDAKDELVENIVAPVNVPSSQTEQVPATGTEVEPPSEEIELLRKTVITMERSLSRMKDFVTRIQ